MLSYWYFKKESSAPKETHTKNKNHNSKQFRIHEKSSFGAF